jgi:hypothetical protein
VVVLGLAWACARQAPDEDPPAPARAPFDRSPPPHLWRAIEASPLPSSPRARIPPTYHPYSAASGRDGVLACESNGHRVVVLDRFVGAIVSMLEARVIPIDAGSDALAAAIGETAIHVARKADTPKIVIDTLSRTGKPERPALSLPPDPEPDPDVPPRIWLLPRAGLAVLGGSGRLLVASLGDGSLLGEVRLPRGVASHVASAPDGRTFAVATLDGVRIHAPNGELRAELAAPPAFGARFLAWTAPGELTSVQSEHDGRMRVALEHWSIAERRRKRVLLSTEPGPIIAASESGRWLVLGGAQIPSAGARAALDSARPIGFGCALRSNVFVLRGPGRTLKLVRAQDGAVLELVLDSKRPLDSARVRGFFARAAE